MTYCVAIKLNDGLVFAADSRTSAGVDDVSIYSKLHVFEVPDERFFVLLSAGNLATTQAVVNQLRRDMDDTTAPESLKTLARVDDAAGYVGRINRRIREEHNGDATQRGGFNPEATFIVGGQIGTAAHDIFLVYPQGNYISASPEQPFLQIGETKYGKPILDRIIGPETPLETAARCAMVSLGATRRSNLTVGPPFELLLYVKDRLRGARQLRFENGDAFWDSVQETWAESLRRAIEKLPRFEWESRKSAARQKRSLRR